MRIYCHNNNTNNNNNNNNNNNFLLDCKSKVKILAKSENPPRLENGRKKGFMRIMKKLLDDSGFGIWS